jgi:hypothetical protein
MTRRPYRWDEEYLKKLSDEDFIEVFAIGVADRTILSVNMLELHNPIRHGAPSESVDILLSEAFRRKIPLPTLVGHLSRQ